MPHIQQLSSHVADLIAGGEVVERPASVVKELVENAIDAGASAIVVEIQRGGMGLIRVTDNGCGIAPDELPTAFLRHATSKLRTEEDLGKIGTLGFRGEALAAISAVSRVDVLTRQSEDAIGAAIHGEGGAMGPVREEGAPAGTTIRVADLFDNTPARLKFMKKDSAETAAVAGLMQHLALSHPDISFKFIKDGQETLHTPGDGKLESAVYAALGREFAKTLVPVLGVPLQSAALSGIDSLYSIVQMPRGIPVGTLAIGKAGAANAALLAAQILATHDKELHQRLNDWRKAQTDEVLENPDPRGAA